MVNAGVRGRPIPPLMLSSREQAYLERKLVVSVSRGPYLSGAARSCDADGLPSKSVAESLHLAPELFNEMREPSTPTELWKG